ncbi:hypothetical protein ACFL6U_12315 [Planctomycetota bacterium]
MYTIDLLQGTGRPPRPKPLRVAGITLAFVCLAMAGGLMVTSSMGMQEEMAAQNTLLKGQRTRLAELQDVETFLTTTAANRKEFEVRLAEVAQAVKYQSPWSSLLVAISEVVPEEVILSSVEIVREEITTGDAANKQFSYSYRLSIGVLTKEDPTTVETFVTALRELDISTPTLSEVRISNQLRRMLREQEFLYFDIDCQVGP